jgi:hypothetical protein
MLFMNPEIYYRAIFKYVAKMKNKYFFRKILYSLHYLQEGLVSHRVGLTFPVNSFPDVHTRVQDLCSHFTSILKHDYKATQELL